MRGSGEVGIPGEHAFACWGGRPAGGFSAPETQKQKVSSFRRYFEVFLRELRDHRAGALRADAAGAIEPNVAYALIGAMQVLAEAAHHLHADDRVVAQEVEQVLALDECNARIVQQFGAEVVVFAAKGRFKPEKLSRACHTEHQALAALRTDGKFRAALAEQVDPARGPAFGKQKLAFAKYERFLNCIEFADCITRQCAEVTRGTMSAFQAA